MAELEIPAAAPCTRGDDPGLEVELSEDGERVRLLQLLRRLGESPQPLPQAGRLFWAGVILPTGPGPYLDCLLWDCTAIAADILHHKHAKIILSYHASIFLQLPEGSSMSWLLDGTRCHGGILFGIGQQVVHVLEEPCQRGL